MEAELAIQSKLSLCPSFVLSIVHFDIDHGVPYLIYDIPLASLENALSSTFYCSPKKVVFNRILFIAAQVARGLQYAHEQGIIHGRISPSAVMIMSDLGDELGEDHATLFYHVKLHHFMWSDSTDQQQALLLLLCDQDDAFSQSTLTSQERSDQASDVRQFGHLVMQMLVRCNDHSQSDKQQFPLDEIKCGTEQAHVLVRDMSWIYELSGDSMERDTETEKVVAKNDLVQLVLLCLDTHDTSTCTMTNIADQLCDILLRVDHGAFDIVHRLLQNKSAVGHVASNTTDHNHTNISSSVRAPTHTPTDVYRNNRVCEVSRLFAWYRALWYWQVRGEGARAVVMFEQALLSTGSQQPHGAEVQILVSYAGLQETLGHVSEAEQLLRTAVKISPHNSHALAALARFLMFTSPLHHCHRHNYNVAVAGDSLGQESSGGRGEAVQLYSRLRDLQVDHPAISQCMTALVHEAQQLTSQRDYYEAEAVYSLAVAVDSHNQALLLGYSHLLYAHLNRPHEAMHIVDNLLAEYPNDSLVLMAQLIVQQAIVTREKLEKCPDMGDDIVIDTRSMCAEHSIIDSRLCSLQ